MAEVRTVKLVADTKGAVKSVEKLTDAEKKRIAQMKEQEKEQQKLIDSMGVFGMSIGGLKANFKGMKTAASLAFKSIKAGLIATGIGAFVVALGAVGTFFTQTKRGAEILETALAGLGSAFKVIVDRVSQFGSGIVKLFKGKWKEGAKDMLSSFQGIGKEIKEDVKLTTELSKATIALRDNQRELNVETAKRRAEVEALKLIAEDVTKSESERLEAAEKAFQIEQDLLNKRVENAEEAVRIQQEQMATGENTAEDLDKLAELEIALFNIQQESGTKQIELNNKINAIKQETINKTKEQEQAEKDAEKALDSYLAKKTEESNKISNDYEAVTNRNLTAREKEEKEVKAHFEKLKNASVQAYLDGQISSEQAVKDAIAFKKEETDALKKIEKDYSKASTTITKLTEEEKVQIISGALGNIAGALGEESKAAKGLAVAQALIDTYAGATKALAQGGIFGTVAAAGIVAAGLGNVKKIVSTKLPGVSDSSTPSTPDADIPTTSVGGIGGLVPNVEAISPPDISQQPVQAFVVENDISNSQALQEELEIQATL
jgi:hypothetical protein